MTISRFLTSCKLRSLVWVAGLCLGLSAGGFLLGRASHEWYSPTNSSTAGPPLPLLLVGSWGSTESSTSRDLFEEKGKWFFAADGSVEYSAMIESAYPFPFRALKQSRGRFHWLDGEHIVVDLNPGHDVRKYLVQIQGGALSLRTGNGEAQQFVRLPE